MLKAVLESLDGVQEDVQGLYTQQDDGKFYLNIDGMTHDKEIGGLKSALDKERDKRRDYVKRLQEMQSTQSMGQEEAAELEKLRQEIEERDLAEAERRGEFDRVKQSIREKFDAERALLLSDLEKERTLRRSDKLRFEAMDAINEYDGESKLLLPVIEQRTKWSEVDGIEGHFATDENGEVRFDEKGNAVSVMQLVAEMRDDAVFGKAFAPVGKTGTESPTNSRSRRKADPSKMSSNEKIMAGLNEL